MNLLLDTHIYLWALLDDKRLSKKARALIKDAAIVYVSTASLFEIAVKIQKGKFHIDFEKLIDSIEKSGFEELPILANHTKTLCNLPRHHGDPFDHLLIAQALSEPLLFLTADQSLSAYSDIVVLV